MDVFVRNLNKLLNWSTVLYMSGVEGGGGRGLLTTDNCHTPNGILSELTLITGVGTS